MYAGGLSYLAPIDNYSSVPMKAFYIIYENALDSSIR
jgi:hypothetical protein